MSAATYPSHAFPSGNAEFPSGAFPCGTAAVARDVGLFGVVKGFARSVLGLGRVMSGAVARLKDEGADPHSANSGFDFKAVLHLLQRAVLMADALRARLRTPELAVVLARFRAVRTAAVRTEPPQAPVAQPEADETLRQIACARNDERLRRQLRQVIEGMSDREVLTYIYADLREASERLGDTAVAKRIEALGCKASALLGDEPDEVVPSGVAPERMATRPVAYADPDEGPAPERVMGVRPAWRTTGRGPP